MALDLSLVQERFGHGEIDRAFMRDLLTTYLQQAEKTLATMRAGIEFGDRERILLAAHALAGSSLTVGATAVAAACRALEEQLSNERVLPDNSGLRQIQEELTRVYTDALLRFQL